MDSTPRSWLRKRARAAAASVMFLVAGDMMVPALPLSSPSVDTPIALATVRPRVGVRVLIESPLYRKKLDGDQNRCGAQCEALQRVLSDTALVLLATRYGFADWSSAAPGMRDTVTVRLLQRDADGRLVKLQISLGRRATEFGSEPEEVDFETRTSAALRPAADWQTARLRAMWADSLSRRLDTYSERLVSNVLGRLPLNGEVVFDASRPAADVRLLADSLRAADSPAPKFLVRLAMPTATSSGDVVTDTAEMVLDGCRRTQRGYYSCERRAFRWRDLTGTDTLFRQKSRNVQFRTASIHLRTYTPLVRGLAPGGLAAPVGGTP